MELISPTEGDKNMTIDKVQVITLAKEEEETIEKARDIIERIYYELNLGDPIKFDDDDIADCLENILIFLKRMI